MAATIKKGLDEQRSEDTALVIGKWKLLIPHISSLHINICLSSLMIFSSLQLALGIWIMGLGCLKEWDILMVDNASSPAGISILNHGNLL